MKTSLTLLAALTLASGAVFAADRGDRGDRSTAWIDGSEYMQQSPFMSTRSRDAVRAEARATRHTEYVDGSEYELAQAMFMSRKTREQVRAGLDARSLIELHAEQRHNFGGGR